MRISVLMGGTSAERKVSLKSGAAVSGAFKKLGHDVVDIDAAGDLCAELKRGRPDVAFLALHGGVGEDGSVQGMLEVMGIPYTGSGVLASAMAMDKLVSKVMFAHHGLKVPAYEVIRKAGETPALPLPVVVKPAGEGSSVGVSIVWEMENLSGALDAALSYGGPVLVEEYIKGREVQIGVLGEKVLGGVEVRPGADFYSYEAKYTPGMTEYILPPELDEGLYARAKEAGLMAHMALGCRGATRVDLLIDEEETIYVLEVNTIPGMTETSLLPKIAAQEGLSFPALLEEMAREAHKGRRT
jgi:D-alanine-D-alanine ligase